MKHYYTDGLEIITVINESKEGYLVQNETNTILFLSNLNAYRLVDDKRTIYDWYKDSKKFVKKHPMAALSAALGIFFGFTTF